MQLNKSFIILIAIIFSLNNIYAQPSPKRSYFYGNISVSDNNKMISFSSKDSINFISNDSKIKLSAYSIDTESSENCTPLKISQKTNNYLKIKNIKFEYWNHQKIGAFKVLVLIKKTRKTMSVYFDFTNDHINSTDDTNLKKFNIPFQEGVFEVTNDKIPKLLPIKNKLKCK